MNCFYLVRDGQGHTEQLGNPRKAASRAAKHIGCKVADLQILNFFSETCVDVYFFDATQADAAYWLAALKRQEQPTYVGKIGG